MDTVARYKEFNEQVRKGMKEYAERKGWKMTKYSEPKFRKGKGEVYLHTDDATIYGTIGNKFGDEKGGKPFVKHYPQNMSLFSGKYTPSLVKRYIGQGRATLNQLDKKLGNGTTTKVRRKHALKRQIKSSRNKKPRLHDIGGGYMMGEDELLRGVMD